MSKSNAIAIIHKQTICQRLSTGEYLKSIANDLGISVPAISQQLADDPEYISAREQSLDERLIQREGEMELATDQLNLARARELLSHARWRAERECPARWGKDTTPTQAQDTLNTVSAALLLRVASLLPNQPVTNTIEHDVSAIKIEPV